MVKYYELTYTISKSLTPEEADNLFEKIISYFPQATGSAKGYDFFTLDFYAEPEMLKDLEKKLKSESQIKKYMLVKKGVAKAVKTRVRKTPAVSLETPAKEQKVEKVELKEIDKKLKEIFGE